MSDTTKHDKYGIQYFTAPDTTVSWLTQEPLQKPPVWCSVDLRDGNQALSTPMSLEEKLQFFRMLVELGFKEIEVGFPAANDTEYEFCRTLITENLIPDDVTIQVLTQARPHIVARTYEAIAGAKKVIVHLYTPTSVAHREQVFHATMEQTTELAVYGAQLCEDMRLQATDPDAIVFEFSPEGFSATEPDYALTVCQAVCDVWKPTMKRPVIINLPATVEVSMPHIYANQIAYLRNHLVPREGICISLHPHNDRGCAIASAEYGIMAGGERVEGTLFGNGERTGNVDLITLALNFYSQGVDPQLNFHSLSEVCAKFEELTGMQIYARQPYSGQLVYAAFSGSHQDAIAKSFAYRKEHPDHMWDVPYLPVDPDDFGREYETDVIRINSQSGKGGIAYVLQTTYGLNLPKEMHLYFSRLIKDYSDRMKTELQNNQVYDIFMSELVNLSKPLFIDKMLFTQTNGIQAELGYTYRGESKTIFGNGNGRLDAVSNALKDALGMEYKLQTYTEHALADGSGASAVSYVQLCSGERVEWGVGIHSDIMTSSVYALVSALNRLMIDNHHYSL